MPIRDKFPKAYFDGNPYKGESPEDIYRRLRWGNEPRMSFEGNDPESMVSIGEVAQLVFHDVAVTWDESEAPYLAIGADSNRLYVVPRDADGAPVEIPSGPYERVEELEQIDYYSDKGQDDAYYYHEHEEPFPVLYIHRESGVCYIEPAEMEDGSRSYAIGDEGIIG